MKLIVLGNGVSGKAAARLGDKLGFQVDILDDKDHIKVFPECDLIVVSPGLSPLKSPLYQLAAQSGVEMIGELEFAYRYYKGKILAITGTNGKTTTTELTAFLLNAFGVEALTAGNIGIPLSELAADDKDCVAVVEVSSFQLEKAPGFTPYAAVLLNLASDHEDRYAGGYDEYCAVKLGIFDHVPENRQIRGLSFPDAPRRVSVQGHDLYVDGQYVLDLKTTALSAPHNAENLAAATELLLQLVPEACMDERFAGAVRAFLPGRHRQEIAAVIDDITYINDSKATNPASTIAAVRAVSGKCVIMLGGLDKGMDFSVLADLAGSFRAVVLYGECREKIAAVFAGKVSCHDCGSDFDLAFDTAQKLAHPGDTVLLSPACASMDMFKNYQERGDRFCQLAKHAK